MRIRPPPKGNTRCQNGPTRRRSAGRGRGSASHCSHCSCSRRPATAQARDTTATFKDWPVAFTLELLVPTLGHVYAGDFDRGIAPALVTGVGVGIVALSYSEIQDINNWVFVGLLGIGVTIAGKAWGLVSAVRTTLDHNRGLVERVMPVLGVTPDGRALIGVSVRF